MRGFQNIMALNAAAATGAGAAIPLEATSIPHSPLFTWQTSFSGGPATVGVSLEGSIDNGATWFQLDTSTNIAGEVKHVTGKGAVVVRANLTAMTGGASPKATVWIAFL